MKKRLLCMILALSMMLTILPVNAITALAANDGMSGNCGKTGDNVTYVLTQNNDDTTNPTYTLTIQGNGEMADFKESDMEGRAPWIADKEKITAVTIENGVTYVGAYAFDHCKKLTQITIHAQLDSIGEGAFCDCEGLTSIEIPKTVTSIGASAFSRCKGLSNIEIPETVVSIGGAAFNGCTGLTSIKIPAAVTSIKEYTFNECSNLKNVEIPQGVVSIGECAFSGCGILESIKIPQNVTSIGEYAFFGCKTITSIKIPAKVTSISKGILSGCSKLEDVEILGAVTSIGDNAFMSCGKLTDIKIPDTVTSIGKNAFYMSGLTSIKIPNTVTSIGEYAFYVCNSLAKIEMPANMPSILQNTFYRTTTTVDETRVFYYPGYRHNWDQQVSKISDNGNTDLLANDYERVHYYCDVIFDSNGGTFTDVTDGSNTKTIKEVWRKEHLTQEQINSVGKPTKDGKMFIGWNTTQDATTVIDPKSDYIADGKIYYAVYKDAVPATVTISGPTDNTVKAGEGSNVFTVAANKGDTDAAKAKFDFAGGKVQYRTGDTEEWVDLTSNELSIDNLTGKQFRVVPDTDAVTGQKTLTVKMMDASGNEIAGATASTAFAVTARKPAEVTIDGLDGTTVKAGEAQFFTVNVTPNDDTIDKVTFGTTSGEVQWSNDGGNTWTTVPDDVDYSGLTGKKFRVVPAADAANGTVTVTVIAKKADGTEVARKDASFTVTAREHATVKINNLNGETIRQNKAHTFTVTVTANDDSGHATLTFDNVAGLTYNGTAVTDAGVTVTLTNQPAPLTFTLTPDAEGAGKTLTATLNNGAMDTATYTVSEYEHAKVTIDGLDTDLKQGESKDFTVKVDPKDDSGNATIDFGDKNSEIQYKDGEDWKSMPSDGLKIDLNNGKKPYDFRITPKNDGENQKLTATVKKENTKLGEAEKSYNVSKYVDAVVKIDGLSGTVETDTEKEFTVTVTANDDAGKNVTAKAGFTGPAGATITLKKVQYRFGDSGEWQDGMQELNGMNLDINSLELPFNSLPNITYKLTVTFAEAGNYKFDVSLTKKDAAEAFTSDSAEVTVTKKEEPVTPGGGSTGGSENPGENPGGGSGNTNPTPKPDEKPDRKIKIDGGIVEVNGKEVKPDEDGNITVKKGDEITITVDKSKISDAQVFDQWVIKPDSVLNEVDPKSEKISFTMPAEDVTIEAMTRDASIEDDGPGILGTGALIATGVVGSAALLYQGHMLGTELYLRYLLPHGAVIPQNRAELAVLLWQDAENPEPVSTTLYSDISDEDSAIQQAARWVVENDLMEQLDAEEHPDHFDPFVPVTFSDSIRAWKKAQELKKSVH